MNEEIDDFETQLRRWQPRAPRDEVRRRIAADLEPPVGPGQRWWQRLGFRHPAAALGWGFALPAAVAWLTLDAALPPQIAPAAPKSAPPATVTHPTQYTKLTAARATNHRYATDDEGVVLDANQRPVRRTRYLSEETLSWSNPRTGTEVEFSCPREDVVMVPVTTR